MSGVGGAVTAVLVMAAFGLAAYVIGIYNGLVRLKHNVQKAWSNIDVLLKQRHDEIPKLVEVCKGYMKHERETLEKVVQARSSALTADSVARKADAEGGLGKALTGLFALAEKYPDLKANTNFLGLQRRISEVEELIADRREMYNESVNIFNVRIEQIPDVFIARAANYSSRDLYEADEEDREDVKIDLTA